jgi:hypothetical protein
MRGQDIFEIAMDLCALRSGEGALPADTKDLKARSVGLLNVLMGELHGLEEQLTGRICPYICIHSLEESIPLCDGLCTAVLPYRLAALLIAEEDRELYRLLISHSEQAVKELTTRGISRTHGILEVYG